MLVTQIDDETRTGTIILRPNHSATWRANLILFCVLLWLSLSIAIGFLLVGACVILPFTLLEMTVVGACIHYCFKQCSRQEVIIVSDYEVIIQRGITSPSKQETFQRLWAKFLVKPARHPWDPSILSIRSHGIEHEIGSFLNRQDKRHLVEQLKRVVPR